MLSLSSQLLQSCPILMAGVVSLVCPPCPESLFIDRFILQSLIPVTSLSLVPLLCRCSKLLPFHKPKGDLVVLFLAPLHLEAKHQISFVVPGLLSFP